MRAPLPLLSATCALLLIACERPPAERLDRLEQQARASTTPAEAEALPLTNLSGAADAKLLAARIKRLKADAPAGMLRVALAREAKLLIYEAKADGTTPEAALVEAMPTLMGEPDAAAREAIWLTLADDLYPSPAREQLRAALIRLATRETIQKNLGRLFLLSGDPFGPDKALPLRKTEAMVTAWCAHVAPALRERFWGEATYTKPLFADLTLGEDHFPRGRAAEAIAAHSCAGSIQKLSTGLRAQADHLQRVEDALITSAAKDTAGPLTARLLVGAQRDRMVRGALHNKVATQALYEGRALGEVYPGELINPDRALSPIRTIDALFAQLWFKALTRREVAPEQVKATLRALLPPADRCVALRGMLSGPHLANVQDYAKVMPEGARARALEMAERCPAALLKAPKPAQQWLGDEAIRALQLKIKAEGQTIRLNKGAAPTP